MDRLSDHCEELHAALTREENFEKTPGGQWLAGTYHDIVPAVLHNVLHSVDTGKSLNPSIIETIRSSAATTTARIPLHTALHGSLPAIKVFTAFLRTHHTTIPAQRMALLLGRASIITVELSGYWITTWTTTNTTNTADAANTAGVVDPVTDLVPVKGQLEQPDLDMVLLAAQGQSNNEIAKNTDYSTQAVTWHLGRTMRAWNVTNRASLISSALLRGVLRPRNPITSHNTTPPPPPGSAETLTPPPTS
ncbi:hypothetical protein AC792_08645 [Arthrobacter sp. RIT-PI-e]|uniref:LuxR C-terminal-related transcriptional regulator n=1 Tax=Arthrobacter sp. RIT-PI-e TaxID=1681197 RepID=UPI000675E547|nr:LuxR C-terminal-related transcriptional regulator [Arthrobacter sp. RIT-PI-e]KNC19033.1 hypothetical protein AC792_08645 [Arthrobacter sp. RIT-PI-e]